MLYVSEVFGWMSVIEANSEQEALRIAKGRAEGASLLRSDVTGSSIRRATDDDLAWVGMMTGELAPAAPCGKMYS